MCSNQETIMDMWKVLCMLYYCQFPATDSVLDDARKFAYLKSSVESISIGEWDNLYGKVFPENNWLFIFPNEFEETIQAQWQTTHKGG